MWYFVFFFCILALLTATYCIVFYMPFNSKALPITAEASGDAIAVRVANNTKSDIYLNAAGIFYKKNKTRFNGNGIFSTKTIYEVSPMPADADFPALVCKYSSISFSLRNPPAGAAGIYIDFSRFPIENTSTAAYKKICSSEFPYRTVQRYSKSKENFYYRILQTLCFHFKRRFITRQIRLPQRGGKYAFNSAAKRGDYAAIKTGPPKTYV